MQFYYGVKGNYLDITESTKNNSSMNEYIVFPVSDHLRSAIYGDPVPGSLKHILIIDMNKNELIVNANESCVIKTSTNEIEFNNPRFFWNEIGRFIELKEWRLETLHRVMPFNFGSLKDEYPEQLMVVLFLDEYSKVLEIGGNIGRNSCVIGSILEDDRNLVVLECSEDSASKLKHNRDQNLLEFRIETSALSQVPLVQKGWETKVATTPDLGPDWTPVNTITFDELEKKYNITFDTFVLDCEGAFYQILKDNSDCLKNIKTIIMENDYNEIEKKNFIDDILTQNGFVSIYKLPGGWGPCYDFFYEVFRKV